MKKNISENQLNKYALKAGAWYTVSNILLRSVSIITTPIFTRILTTSDYGIASNFIAWQNVMLIFTGLCLTYSIGRAKLDFEDDFDSYISSIQTLATMVAFAFLIFALIFSKRLESFMEMDSRLIIILFVYLVFYPSVDFAQTKFRYRFQYKENIFISVLNTVGVVVFSLLFINIFNDERYFGRVIGTVLAMFLMGIYFYIKIALEGKKFINTRYWRYALKISLPMIPHALSMVILNQIDRIQIMKYSGSSAAGIYSFGYSYAILLSVFANAVSQAWIPWLYENYNKNKLSDIKKSNISINILMCLLTLVFILIAPEALKILGTKEYWDAKWMITPVAIGTLCQYFYSNYSSIEIYHKKTTYIGIGSVIASILVYILNMMFIPKYGYIVASYTTLIGYLFLMIFHNIGYRLIAKKEIFNELSIYFLLVITSVLSFLIMALYNYIILRYVIFFILVSTILVINKNKFSQILTKLKKSFVS